MTKRGLITEKKEKEKNVPSVVATDTPITRLSALALSYVCRSVCLFVCLFVCLCVCVCVRACVRACCCCCWLFVLVLLLLLFYALGLIYLE